MGILDKIEGFLIEDVVDIFNVDDKVNEHLRGKGTIKEVGDKYVIVRYKNPKIKDKIYGMSEFIYAVRTGLIDIQK